MEKKLEACVCRAGLSKSEALVYIALLKAGEATVAQAAAATGLHRRNAYDAVGRLAARGLCSFTVRGKKKLLQPSKPERLEEIMREKIGVLENEERNLREAMPLLAKLVPTAGEKPNVRVFYGKESLKTILARKAAGLLLWKENMGMFAFERFGAEEFFSKFFLA